MTPALLVIAWLLKKWRGEIGDPAVWEELQKRIDDYRNYVFANEKLTGIQRHHRRVTLFQHVRWCSAVRCWPWSAPWPRGAAWPWHGWLVPVIRSGHTTQASGTIFRVPYYRSEDAEGVAGQAWVSEGWILLEGLSDVKDVQCAEDTLREYAEATRMNLSDLKKKRAQGCSFAAVRVEVKGKPWGVLVIDSTSQSIPGDRADNSFKKSFSSQLELMLPRI